MRIPREIHVHYTFALEHGGFSIVKSISISYHILQFHNIVLVESVYTTIHHFAHPCTSYWVSLLNVIAQRVTKPFPTEISRPFVPDSLPHPRTMPPGSAKDSCPKAPSVRTRSPQLPQSCFFSTSQSEPQSPPLPTAPEGCGQRPAHKRHRRECRPYRPVSPRHGPA